MTLLNVPPDENKQAMTSLPSIEQDSGGQVLEFRGLDLREKADSGSFLECSNVSTRNYPCLSPRIGRSYRDEARYQNVDDLFRFDGRTVYRKGTTLYYDSETGSGMVATVADSRKKFAVVNNIIVVFPDAIGINIATGKTEPLGLSVAVGGTVAVSDNRALTGSIDGLDTISSGWQSNSKIADGVYLRIPYYETEPYTEGWSADSERVLDLRSADPMRVDEVLGGKWIIPAGDSAEGFSVRFQHYSRHEGEKFPEQNAERVYGLVTSAEYLNESEDSNFTYIRLNATLTDKGNGGRLKKGDVVFVSGLYIGDEKKDDVAFRVWGISPDRIDFGLNALYGYSVKAETPVRIERRIPPLDFICANSNRVWGVSNAVENTVLDDDGNPVTFNGRAVFCSKLGDPANWYYYQGVSMDSWTAAVASEGDFTGICSWSDDVLCFKERELFRITGSGPSSYTLYSFSVPGVEQGSGGSIAIIDEIVYYKNERGVYRYSGGTPTRVSENVADTLAGEGNAGTDGRNYFLSVNTGDPAEKRNGIYVYDTWHNAWSKHDTAYGRFAWDGGTVLLLNDVESSDRFHTISRVDGGSADNISWEVTLHPDYGTTSTGYYSYSLNMGWKYYKFVFLRGELRKENAGAGEPYVRVYAKMGDRDFDFIGQQKGAGKFVLRMPVERYREDCIQLMLRGYGDCVLRDIRYVYSTGSEWIQKDKGVL